MFTPDDIIFSYTTQDALTDGVLVRADQDLLKQAGITVPVFITESVWKRYIAVPEGVTGKMDSNARLWDILFLLSWAAKNCPSDQLTFCVRCQVPKSAGLDPNERASGEFQFRDVTLKAKITAADIDDPSPAIFVMKPWED